MTKQTFKQFLEGIGKHGEIEEDVGEKYMVHEIIRLCLAGDKSEKNFSTAYSFIESDVFEPLYDKYQKAFTDRAAQGREHKLGTSTTLDADSARLIGEFRSTIPKLFKEFLAKAD